MSKEEIRKKAEAHADWLCSVIRKIYIDAFIHGYKHGEEGRGE